MTAYIATQPRYKLLAILLALAGFIAFYSTDNTPRDRFSFGTATLFFVVAVLLFAADRRTTNPALVVPRVPPAG